MAEKEREKRHGLRSAVLGSACVMLVLALALHSADLDRRFLPATWRIARSSAAPGDSCKASDSSKAAQQTPTLTTQTAPQDSSQEPLVIQTPNTLTSEHHPVRLLASENKSAQASCKLQGSLNGCCNCTYGEVDDLNERVIYPTVNQLVATPFFRYFKVNLYCDCPLWPDDSMCMMRACSVCTCEKDELPQNWLQWEAHPPSCKAPARHGSSAHHEPASAHHAHGEAGEGGANHAHEEGHAYQDAEGGTHGTEGRHDSHDHPHGEDCTCAQCAARADSVVNRDIQPQMLARLQHLKGWRGLNNPWMAPGEDSEEYWYINLLGNPERYTGYQGEHAHRIWSNIYEQSCFTELEDCSEKQLFYRLISGMHTSISAHIAANYLLDEDQGLWGPSMEQFENRLGNTAVTQRVKNLYFAYLFVLRAVTKAAPLLRQYHYDTEMPEEDARTQRLIKDLLDKAALPSACFMPFEPGRLFQGEAGERLREQFQTAFRNITRIMDCVGCEKCKLWGKLQTLGIATALKVCFSSPDCSTVPDSLTLERNEVIALLNLLERFAASLHYYRSLSQQFATEMQALDQQAFVPTTDLVH